MNKLLFIRQYLPGRLKYWGCSTDKVMSSLDNGRYNAFAKSLLKFRQSCLQPEIKKLKEQLKKIPRGERENSPLKKALQQTKEKQKKYEGYLRQLAEAQELRPKTRQRLFGKMDKEKDGVEVVNRQAIYAELKRSIVVDITFSQWRRGYAPVMFNNHNVNQRVLGRQQLDDALISIVNCRNQRTGEARMNDLVPDLTFLRRDNLQSNHRYTHSYADEAILRQIGAGSGDKVHRITLHGTPAWRINGKTVLLQQAIKGDAETPESKKANIFLKEGAAAAAAMVIADRKSGAKVKLLQEHSETGEKIISRLIKEAGLAVTKLSLSASLTNGEKMTALQEAMQKQEPAIMYVKSRGNDGGYVIVDAVSEKSVTLRDPYHGWMVEVTRDAFMASLPSFNDIFQITA